MRFCVNAAVTCDAWILIEADDLEDAKEQAVTLEPQDFEIGDPLAVSLTSVIHDA